MIFLRLLLESVSGWLFAVAMHGSLGRLSSRTCLRCGTAPNRQQDPITVLLNLRNLSLLCRAGAEALDACGKQHHSRWSSAAVRRPV